MYLPDEVQKLLRSKKIISENEVVLKEADLYIAVNVITQNKRTVYFEKNIIEKHDMSGNKKILKG